MKRGFRGRISGAGKKGRVVARLGIWNLKPESCTAGFSLIELAIFLTVIALVMSAALSWLSPSSRDEAQKILVTNQRIHGIQDALRAFRVQQGRLPCPADPLQADNTAEAGTENCSGITHSSEDLNLGMVPFRTLGLSSEYRLDGWGRRFTYQVAIPICGLDGTGDPANCSAETYKDAECDPEDPEEGYLTVRTVRPGAPDPTDPTNAANYINNRCVAYVVVSHGLNGDGSWMPAGSQRLSGRAASTCDHSACKEQYNISRASAGKDDPEAPDLLYWDDIYSSEFDDFIVYASKQQLDFATLDFENPPVSERFCRDYDGAKEPTPDKIDSINEALAKFTVSAAQTLNSDAAFTATGASRAEDMLSLLWYLQDVCRHYYPSLYKEDKDIACPPTHPTYDPDINLDVNELANNHGACKQ